MASKKQTRLAVVPPPQSPAFGTEPLLLPLKDAAQVLGCTIWAVRGLIWDGQVPYVKIGRRYLISPDDLREFIRREKTGGAR